MFDRTLLCLKYFNQSCAKFVSSLKNITQISCILFLGLFSGTLLSAESDIDSALKLLLEDVEVDRYLKERQKEQLEGGVYRIQPGDTLDQIISITIPNSGIKKQFIRSAFVQANPGAFRSQNPNWLLAGKEMRIPTAQDILALIFVEAPESTSKSTRNWIKFP
ncbi:hypothetical protein OAD56_03245 [Gammaproteobacteria bacterium]|jgi:hypothetical protein|nr:hypothetical protein [Gammaproteobacteria bacterium]MDB2376146.1 hypothetical protein [Gammaproteobacteria bacterium]MDB9950399.1 hypothetical protein [Gammaproteobacteria bacterium]MDC3361851.1 hypothetical protein [Gammaproteobacteria bacterium]